LPAVDPTKYVISVNLHRRHLTAEQKRDLIGKLLKAAPEKSDRQIGKMAQVSKNTAKSVRDELEARGEIDHVETRTDTKGRKQAARKLSVKKHRRTPEEIGVDRFKHGIENTTRHLETLGGWVPQQLIIEDADWAIEQIRCGERALRAIANRIKQVVAPKPAEPAAPDGDGLDIPEWLQRATPKSGACATSESRSSPRETAE
jgi:hypothetical protein